MTRQQVTRLVDQVAVDLPASAVAVGAAVAETTALAYRGSIGGTPVGPGSLFYGASLTKQLVGFLLARAVEQGLAAEHDCITTWLPALPGWLSPVRLHHLIHHTSGLPDLTGPWFDGPADNAALVERLRRHPGVAPAPGTAFAYCNAGFVLLAEALTAISGTPFRHLVREVLLDPLGMARTRLGPPAVQLPGVLDPPGTVGDGGLWTCATDLLTWLRAANARRVDAAAHRRAETPGRLADGTPVAYAWGVGVTAGQEGPMFQHGGTWPRWLAKTARIPERGVAALVLAVSDDETAVSEAGTGLARALARLVRPQPRGTSKSVSVAVPGPSSAHDPSTANTASALVL